MQSSERAHPQSLLLRSVSMPQSHHLNPSPTHQQSPTHKELQKLHDDSIAKQELIDIHQKFLELEGENKALQQQLAKAREIQDLMTEQKERLDKVVEKKNQQIRQLEGSFQRENDGRNSDLERMVSEMGRVEKSRAEEILFLEAEHKGEIERREEIIKSLEEQLQEQRVRNDELITSMGSKINQLEGENQELEKEFMESQLEFKEYKNSQNQYKNQQLALQSQVITRSKDNSEVDTSSLIQSKQREIQRLNSIITQEREANKAAIWDLIKRYESVISIRQSSGDVGSSIEGTKQERDIKVIKNSDFSISNNEDYELEIPSATPLRQQILEIEGRQSRDGLKMRHSFEFENRSGFSEKYFSPEEYFTYRKEIEGKIEEEEDQAADSLNKSEPMAGSQSKPIDKKESLSQNQETHNKAPTQQGIKDQGDKRGFGTIQILSVLASIPLVVYAIKRIFKS